MSNKLKEIIFKPKWLHKSPAIRGRAVAESRDPRLVAMLPDLARNDEDASVRLKAARRLTDMYYLMRLSTEDADAQVRAFADKAYRSMMTGEHPNTPEVEVRLELVPKLDDQGLIEHLARNAREREIRKSAQRRIEKQGLLGDIAIKDKDAELRFAAADRISQKSTLERVAAIARKQDKKVYRLVTEKLEAQQLEAGDDSALQHKARMYCEELEALGRSARSQKEKAEQLAAIETRWDDIKAGGVGEFAARFHGARLIVQRAISHNAEDAREQRAELATTEVQALLSTIEQAQGEHQDIATVQGLIERGQQTLDAHSTHLAEEHRNAANGALESLAQTRQRLLDEQPAAASLTRLLKALERMKIARTSNTTIERLRHDWDREWSGLTHPHASDHALKSRFQMALAKLTEGVKAAESQRAEALQSLDGLMEKLDARLEEGNLAKSAKAKQRVLDALRSIGRNPRVDSAEFKARLNAAKSRLHELRDWQHWSNNEHRERICQRVEEIPGSSMHPDAVAARLRELRERWRELDDGERLPGDAPNRMPNPKLWHRFQAGCNKAFKPAKTYFEKRDEIRDSHLEDLQNTCKELDAAVADKENQDWKQMERLVGTGRRSLRDLHQIAPRMRGKISKRLREAANALDERLDERYAIVERQKQALIDRVSALADETDMGKATSAAKEAQKQWQTIGHVRRKREQQMWKEFRAASDAVFGRLDQQKAGEREARDQARSVSQGLIEEMKSLLKRNAGALEDGLSEMQRIQGQWRHSEYHDRPLDQQFAQLCDDLQAAVKSAQREQRLALKNAGREIVNLCRQLESTALGQESNPKLYSDWSVRWQEACTESDLPAQITERYQRAMSVLGGELGLLDYQQQAEANIEVGQKLSLEAEYLAGAETPAEFQLARMDFQVSRLSARMGGAESLSAGQEAEELEQRWLACGPLPESQAQSVDQRFLAAIRQFESHQD